jgi:type IV pilus assembly protein PilW
MMVGIVVGLVVLWGMSTVYINSVRSSRVTTTANQLNQDMRAVMDIMVNDIRRAGYWDGAAAGTNPFTAATTNIQISNLATDADCILYSYDATHLVNTAGVDAGTDFFGFRLAGSVVQTVSPTAGLADTATACANTQWMDLTDERAINVTRLTFVTGDSADVQPENGSKCLAFNPATYTETVSSTFTEWTAKPTTGVYRGPACAATAPNATASAADATNTFIETRQIRITLTANSVSDTALSRTLTETVLVRNNRLITP